MKDGDEQGDEVVCEFFGIKITTRNPNVARVLTTDISKVMNLDVKEVKTFLTRDQAEDEPDSPSAGQPDEEDGTKITTAKGSLSSLDDLNKMLGDDDDSQ